MAIPIGAIEAMKAAGSTSGIGQAGNSGMSASNLSALFGDADAGFASPTSGPSFSALGAPDAPAGGSQVGSAASFEGIMKSVNATGAQLSKAQATETAFAHHVPGVGIQDVIIERAKADVLLKVASSAASKATQAASTILNMQM